MSRKFYTFCTSISTGKITTDCFQAAPN
uniref:Uncharacterized protein n=1 Tax=Arundo donax TaxID=35708 RepID=A0A0A9HPV6_ARUDO